MSMGTRLQATTLLCYEALFRPRWALQHVVGALDYRVNAARTQVLSQQKREEWKEALDRLIPASREELNPAHYRTHPIGNSAIPPNFAGSNELCAIIAEVIRRTSPKTVLEIGVGEGTTTTTILRALESNGGGSLHSIEFPSLRFGYEQSVGTRVPDQLKTKWTLLWGPSAFVLPEILSGGLRAEVVIHDAAHSYWAQKADLSTIASFSQIGDVIIIDDVTNDAFHEVISEPAWVWALIDQSKSDPVGVAVRVR